MASQAKNPEINAAQVLQRHIELDQKPPASVITTFYRLDPTPEVRAIVSAGLAAKTLNPDETLLAYVSQQLTDGQLLSMAIALRYSANPNTYVSLGPKRETLHILAYLHLNWRSRHPTGVKDDYLTMATLTLLACGANPMLPAVDNDAGLVRPASMDAKRSPNVIEWLDAKKYPHVLKRAYPDLKKAVSAQTLKQVAILSGNVSLMTGLTLTEKDTNLIMRSRANDELYVGHIENLGGQPSEQLEDNKFDLASLLPPPKTMNGLDYNVIFEAVQYYNDKLIEYYAYRGIYMSYPLINTVILRIRQYQQTNNPVLRDIFLRMLEFGILNGMQIDVEQRNLLSSLSAEGEIYRRLIELYTRPYWEKECSHINMFDNKVPERLLTIAHEVGLESQSHSSICLQLADMATMNQEDLKETTKQRQRMRISAQHAKPGELTGDAPFILACANQVEIEGDPFDITDLNLGHYRDVRGDLWCFTSDQFESLVEGKANPINNERLPDSFLADLRFRLERLKALGRDPRRWQRYSELVDSITKPDTVTNTFTDVQVTRLIELMSSYGLSRKGLETISAPNLDQAVTRAGYSANLRYLTRIHALNTVAYIINGFMIADPERGRRIALSVAQAGGVTITLARPQPAKVQAQPRTYVRQSQMTI